MINSWLLNWVFTLHVFLLSAFLAFMCDICLIVHRDSCHWVTITSRTTLKAIVVKLNFDWIIWQAVILHAIVTQNKAKELSVTRERSSITLWDVLGSIRFDNLTDFLVSATVLSCPVSVTRVSICQLSAYFSRGPFSTVIPCELA